MSDVNSLHKILDSPNWTYDQIQQLLQVDSSTVNQMLGGKAPLHRVLEDSKLSTDTIKLLVHYGADTDLLDCYGVSPLTMSLSRRDRVGVVRILVEGGARVYPEVEHPLCTLGIALANDVELEIIEMLLKAGADFNKSALPGRSPLFFIMGYRKVDMEGLKSLLESQGVSLRVRNQYNSTLLHRAMSASEDCPLSFVQYLIDKGLEVDAVDDFGNTPMHDALYRQPCKLSLVKLLLENGSDINKENRYGETPLVLAITAGYGPGIIKFLLNSSSEISPISFMKAFGNYNADPCMEKYEVFLLLLKFVYLLYPDFDMIHVVILLDVIQGHVLYPTLYNFSRDCQLELRRMKSEEVGSELVLYDFVHSFSGTRMKESDCKEGYDIDLLLKIIADNTYPLYSEILSDKLDRSLLIEILAKLSVYAFENSSESKCITKKVLLNSDVLYGLADLLPDRDLLKFILAFIN